MLVVSTQGDGEPPDDSRAFVEFLLGKRAPKLPACSSRCLGWAIRVTRSFARSAASSMRAPGRAGRHRFAPSGEADVDMAIVAAPWLAHTLEQARELRQALAIYMGVGELATPQSRLLAHGRAADTPFALIENGSRAEQRVVTGTLGHLVERARVHAVRSPALLIMGEVAALAGSLAWFGRSPLGAPVVEMQTARAPRRAARPAGADVLAAIHRG